MYACATRKSNRFEFNFNQNRRSEERRDLISFKIAPTHTQRHRDSIDHQNLRPIVTDRFFSTIASIHRKFEITMFDPLAVLPIEITMRKCLQAYGFTIVKDIATTTPEKLSKIIKRDLDDCRQVDKLIREHIDYRPKLQNGLEWFKQSIGRKVISTLCKSIDNLIGMNGFPLGRLIELYGEAGCGKTQLCLQLCVTVQIPAKYGGIESHALFVDTEHCFRPERLMQIGRSFVQLIQDRHPNDDDGGGGDGMSSFTEKSVMDNVHLLIFRESIELISLIHYRLDEFLHTHPKVKLVIIDSIAFPFRHGYNENMSERTKILLQIAQKLREIAIKFDVCIILTNQTAFSFKEDEIIPALGQLWSHSAFIKIQLSKVNENYRCATLQKSNMRPRSQCFFSITPNGICDLPSDTLQTQLEEEEEQNQKHVQEIIAQSQQVYRQSDIYTQAYTQNVNDPSSSSPLTSACTSQQTSFDYGRLDLSWNRSMDKQTMSQEEMSQKMSEDVQKEENEDQSEELLFHSEQSSPCKPSASASPMKMDLPSEQDSCSFYSVILDSQLSDHHQTSFDDIKLDSSP